MDKNSDNSSGQIDPSNQNNVISQVVPPVSYVQVGENTVTNNNNQTSNVKKNILVSVLIIMFISSILILIYFLVGKRFLNSKDGATVSNYSLSNLENKNQIINNQIVYTTRDKDVHGQIYVYDIDSQQNLSVFDQINNNYEYIQIGEWSPNGRYLPIIAYNFPNDNKISQVSVFIYNAIEKSIKKIYESSPTEDYATVAIWETALEYGYPWLDDEKLILENDRDFVNKFSDITYITLSGELKKERINNDYYYKQSNSRISVNYDFDSNSALPLINSVILDGKMLSFKPQDSIVGVLNNKLVTMKVPKGLDLRFDDYNVANENDQNTVNQEIERLKGLGLSDSEITSKLFEFIQPKGDTLIQLYDVNSGNILSSFDISQQGQWWTGGLLVHPDNKTLIAHQTDKMMLPTRERYVLIDPFAEQQISVLSDNNYYQGETGGYFALKKGSIFNLTNDGRWIISFREVTESDSSIYIKNIETLEERMICNSDCYTFSNYNPLIIR